MCDVLDCCCANVCRELVKWRQVLPMSKHLYIDTLLANHVLNGAHRLNSLVLLFLFDRTVQWREIEEGIAPATWSIELGRIPRLHGYYRVWDVTCLEILLNDTRVG